MRRCALELRAGAIVNLGIGMPEGVGAVAAEELVSDLLTMTAEPGIIAMAAERGLTFTAATPAQCAMLVAARGSNQAAAGRIRPHPVTRPGDGFTAEMARVTSGGGSSNGANFTDHSGWLPDR